MTTEEERQWQNLATEMKDKRQKRTKTEKEKRNRPRCRIINRYRKRDDSPKALKHSNR